MTTETATATMLMDQSFAQQRRVARDRAVATKCSAEAVARLGDREPESLSELHRMLHDVALEAAYMAIQEERSLHAEDIAMLNKFAEVQLNAAMMHPKTPIVAQPPQASPEA